MKQKRVLCINDISSIGKCSLTVALPIISTMGIEAVVMPTAILSAHTVFEGYTFLDTTEHMKKSLSHFDQLGEKFDCIYVGYLGSIDQINIVENFIKSHTESVIIVDPVMGDNGKLYSGFSSSYPKEMLRLCSLAHIITPNFTEANLLTNSNISEVEDIDVFTSTMINKLNKTAKSTVVTGVNNKSKVGVYYGDNTTAPKRIAQSCAVNKSLHGAGDIFASVLASLLVLEYPPIDSIRYATDFVDACITETVADKDSQWYGLRFENCLEKLYKLKK